MVDVAAHFPGARDCHYLATASMCLANAPAATAMTEAIEEWRTGRFDWTRAEAAGEDCRAGFASLVGADREDVALTNGAGTGAATIAAQLPDGDGRTNVVVPAIEFTSNFFAWTALADRGYEVRLVPAAELGPGGAGFAARVDAHTAVVAVSAVQSATGERADLAALAALAVAHDARLVVDGSQAAGALDLDVVRDGLGALFCCDHKFLLGARGLGYLWVEPGWAERFRPVVPGWRAAADPLVDFYGPDAQLATSAARLDTSLAWLPAIADREGLRLLGDVGTVAIEGHIADLASHLRARLDGSGLPAPPESHGVSTIVSLPLDGPEDTIGRRLRERGVVASFRGGRLRISWHLYTTRADLDALVEATLGV